MPPLDPTPGADMDLSMLQASLHALRAGVGPDQLQTAERFVSAIGGMDNAAEAVRMLLDMESRRSCND